MIARLVPILVAILAGAGVVRADQWDAFNATVSYSWLHDDNLFRLNDRSSVPSPSDNIYTLGFVGTFDKTLSRQKLHAEASVQDSRYQQHSFLNNQPYNIGGAWLWQFGNSLSGQLRHLSTRSISSFENYQAVLKNIYTTGTDSASVRFQVHPDWFVEGFGQSYRARQSLFSASDLDVRETHLSVLHVRPNGDQFEVRATRREGDYPNHGGGIDYQFVERQFDALMTMVVTGSSSITASFGRLRRTNPYAPERDFSGQIGKLAWNWLPTGKLSLSGSFERTLGAKEDLLSSFALTDRLHLGATWFAATKLQLQASIDRWRSDFRGDPGIVAPGLAPARRDDGRSVTIGARYQILRSLLASLQLTESWRDTDHPDFFYYSGIPYRDTLLWLSVQWSF